MASQSEIRQQITERILEALKTGTPPWRKPWSDLENAGFPANAVSKRPYSGINPLLLELTAHQRGYQSRWWATFDQWKAHGLHVKARPSEVQPGQWGTKIVFCKPLVKTVVNDEGQEENEKFFVLRTYCVFCADQVQGEGIEEYLARPRSIHSFVDYAPAEESIQATGADIQYGGSRAAYFLEDDCIRLPPKESFLGQHEFYSTAFHELAHWTGNESRLSRLEMNVKFGKEAYAFEELVAEIAGCFACTELGLPQSSDLTNHNAYLDHWLKVLQNDHGAILRASSQASKAVDFVLSFSRKDEPVDNAEEPVVAG